MCNLAGSGFKPLPPQPRLAWIQNVYLSPMVSRVLMLLFLILLLHWLLSLILLLLLLLLLILFLLLLVRG